jgi:hypothetical protein
MKSGYRSILGAYHRLHVPIYWTWVASHPPQHDSALNARACIPRR